MFLEQGILALANQLFMDFKHQCVPDRQNVGIKHTNSDKDPNSKEAIPTVKDDKV